LSANFVYPADRRGADTYLRLDGPRLSFSVGELGPAAGIDLVNSRQFPDEVQGRLLANQVSGTFRGTLWWDIEDDGTTYQVKRVKPDLLVSNDPFARPIAMTFGPDGALYLVDFYTPLVENTSEPKRYSGRDHSHGRIWRIVYKDRPLLTPPKIVGEPTPVLLELLKEYENTTRHFARRELQERDSDDVIPHLEKWLAELDPADPNYELYSMEGLWIYQGLEVVSEPMIRRMLQANDPRIRAAATRVLRFWQDRIDGAIDLLSERVEDENIRVRMQAVLALSFSLSDEARNIALRVTKHPMDVGITNVLRGTMEYFERAGSTN